MDEQLAAETKAYRRGSPTAARAYEWREPEPSAEGEPNVSAVPHADTRTVAEPALAMSPDDIEGRARVGRFLARSVFPADRDSLLRAARAAKAPDDVLATIGQLPPGVTFPTVARVWAALGHPLEQRS
jgi:hypothetical protein